jgi:hypothetical protein
VAILKSIGASSSRNLANTKVQRRKKSAIRAGMAPRRNSDAQSHVGAGRRVSIPLPLRVFLGSERDAVIKVQSLLLCIGQAMEFQHPARGPYYPDILELAAKMLRQRVVNFDALLLDGLVPQGMSNDSAESDHMEC